MGLMKFFGGGKTRSDPVAIKLHESVMEYTLQPIFFGSEGAEDTFQGRFEVVTLFASLVMRRLRMIGENGQDLAQDMFDELFSGFDDALREIGTGDLRVGKKIRNIGEAFYGRAKAYDSALDAENASELLTEAIERNMEVNSETSKRFAVFAQQVSDHLEKQSTKDLLKGQIDWPTVSD